MINNNVEICVSKHNTLLLEKALRDVGLDERNCSLSFQHCHYHTVFLSRLVHLTEHPTRGVVTLAEHTTS